MHDQSLEQKLRATLQAEGDALPFTITPAELERRLALRRRGGMSRMASLGLAAAVGIGLLGLAGLAGGWFEGRTAIVPSPSSSPRVATSPAPVGSAEPSAAVRLLPSLDEFLATHDPAAVVRAQAMGPAAGPAADAPPESRWTGFAPMAAAGSYAVEIACLGSDDLQLQVVSANPGAPGRSWPFSCDGSPSARMVDLRAGDGVGVFSSQPASWRIAVLAAGRQAPRAEAIVDIPFPADREVVFEARSEATIPDYGPIETGGGLWVPEVVGSVINRPAYRVLVTCAGPNPIRYAFGTLYDESNPPDPLPEDRSATQVECDGALHEDVIDVPLVEGARLIVTSDAQTAWRIQGTADRPPIGLAPNIPGWTRSTGFGPNWMTGGSAESFGGIGPDDGGPVRVVVTCSGQATVTGTIDVGTPAGSRSDPFSLDCAGGPDGQTLERSYERGSNTVDVFFDPHGQVVWLAITTQVQGPAVPLP